MKQKSQDKCSIDMAQFNQVFFEECAEHLAEMENILLSLSNRDPDDEQLNAIFRAAHSIKGGAGMFGFQDMTIVTHALESLLDKLRDHEIAFSSLMIDLFLEAGDVIAMQLAGYREGSDVDQEAVEQIRDKLQKVIDKDSNANPRESGEGVFSDEGIASVVTADRRYDLFFTPDPDIFRRGVRMENLIADLEELGALTVRAQLEESSDLSTSEPKDCHTSWTFSLETAASEAEIMEIFEFVADEEQLLVRDITSDKQIVTCVNQAASQVDLPTAPTKSAAAIESMPTINNGSRAYDKNELAPGAYGRRAGEAESSIRVGVTKVDQLINQVGELVITQLMLAQTASALDPVLYEDLHRSLMQLEHNTRDLQQSVMSIRLVPISVVFSRFPRWFGIWLQNSASRSS